LNIQIFDDFIGKLEKRYAQQGYARVVVAEGVNYKGSYNPISQDESNVDDYGHYKLGGAAQVLAARVKKELGII